MEQNFVPDNKIDVLTADSRKGESSKELSMIRLWLRDE